MEDKVLTIPNNKNDVREKGSLTDAIASYYLQNGAVDSGKALAIAKSVVATIKSNDYLMKIVNGNIDSLIDCINQAISIGLTIDANQYCWLVPYKGKIQLQIGYKGYIYKINKAFPSARIQAILVYEGDKIEIKKVANNDIANHEFKNPFEDDDKKIIAVYSIIVFSNGHSIIERMSKKQINEVKAKAPTQVVWNEWYGEMVKKSVIRRMCKSLFPSELADLNAIDNEQYDLTKPKTDGLDKLNNDNKIKIES